MTAWPLRSSDSGRLYWFCSEEHRAVYRSQQGARELVPVLHKWPNGTVCTTCGRELPRVWRDPIAETAREIETREASAGPIAEVPFSLSPEHSTRRAVDGRLF